MSFLMNFERNPIVYSVFNNIFETVSAYGCVVNSVGLPDRDYSFAGALSTSSKVVLRAVMVRGRHKGLRVQIDKAVSMPREEKHVVVRIQGGVGKGRAV